MSARYDVRTLDDRRIVMAGYLTCGCMCLDVTIDTNDRLDQALDDGFAIRDAPVTCPTHGTARATICDPTRKAQVAT